MAGQMQAEESDLGNALVRMERGCVWRPSLPTHTHTPTHVHTRMHAHTHDPHTHTYTHVHTHPHTLSPTTTHHHPPTHTHTHCIYMAEQLRAELSGRIDVLVRMEGGHI